MWTIVVVGLVLGALFFLLAGAQGRADQASAKRGLAAVPGYEPCVVQSTGYNKPSISLDAVGERFAIAAPGEQPKVFRFNQLVAVEIEKNGQSITRTNRGDQAAGAAAGAILLGPAGLLLGGLSGSKRHEEMIKRVTLKIYTNDLLAPITTIHFLDSWSGFKADSFIVRTAANSADEWHGRFRAILHGQAEAKSIGLQNQLNAVHRNDHATSGVGPIDLGQTALNETAAREEGKERAQAVMARIEHRRLRRANKAKLEPRH